MMEDKELGIKIAENTDERFWIETKEKCQEAIKAEHRNIKINEQILDLCNKELELFGIPNN